MLDMLDMLGQPQQLLSFQILIESRDMTPVTPVTPVTAVTARCGSNHDGRPFCPDPTWCALGPRGAWRHEPRSQVARRGAKRKGTQDIPGL